MPHSDHSSSPPPPGITIIPVKHEDGKTLDIGADVYGVDLNNFTDEEFKQIEDALYKYKVLSFKDQKEMLHPTQQYKLTSSFDENCPGGFAHGVDPLLLVHNGVEIKGHPNRVSIPIQPEVHILGRGRVPPNHYGMPPDMDIVGVQYKLFHKEPHIPDDEMEAGATRFFQWHFDGALYKISPPRVGCLLAVRVPHGPAQTVHWDDGTGTTMPFTAGGTAYISGSSALARLTAEQRAIALHSSIEYAPHCFKWMSRAHSTRLGHGIETEGLEVGWEELEGMAGGKIEDGLRKVYPMVWTNPRTGELSLQIHGQAALKLHLRSGPDEEVKVVDDIKEVREFMHSYMRPAIVPENIYCHTYKEKDVVLWYNRALWHSIVEYPLSYGPRIMHQCNVAASDDPK